MLFMLKTEKWQKYNKYPVDNLVALALVCGIKELECNLTPW